MAQTSARQMLATLNLGGMTDAQIAAETAVSQPTITRIRNGKHGEPKLSTYTAINELYLRKQAESAAESKGQHGAH